VEAGSILKGIEYVEQATVKINTGACCARFTQPETKL
jgi:hypothetical protein